MENTTFDSKRINEILENTLSIINEGREEIFEIAEKAREECDLIKRQLIDLQKKVTLVIDRVDTLEVKEKKSRVRLLHVSKNFNRYTEEDIKEAYETANDLRIQLIVKKQEEKSLIEKRTDLELRLKNAMEIVERAERLVNQVGVAIEFLSGNLNNIMETIKDMNKRQMLGIRIIQAQEEERHRVAREIHDGPAQSMANVVLKAEICERLISKDIEKAKEEIRHLKEIVRTSLKDVRRIIYDLRPMSLDDLGLIPTLQRYSHNFSEDTGIEVDIRLFGKSKSVASIVELAIFRMLQEALNNIKKHSKATKVLIKIETITNKINVIIEDNGIGFDTTQIKENEDRDHGFGIMGMRERAELLEGKIAIKSILEKGTKIIISIPLGKKEDSNGS